MYSKCNLYRTNNICITHQYIRHVSPVFSRKIRSKNDTLINLYINTLF